MNKYAALSFVAFSVSSPPLSADTLIVEYEGIVGEVENPQFAPDLNYRVGDPIKGSLKIDTALAPPDLYDWDPTAGEYRVTGDEESPDFVTGDRLKTGRHWDIVSVVANQGLSPRDEFRVTDRADATSPTSYSRIFSVDAVWPEGGPLEDQGLQQSFEATPEKDGSLLSGIIQRVRGGLNFFTTTIHLSLNRMEVCSR